MPTFLDTLLALNGVNLPPLPAPAAGMPLMPAPAPPISVGPPPAMPEAAARAPAPPLDLSLINQYQQFAGPPPTPPVVQQPGMLDKLAAIFSGIAQGPQYGAQLREERQRPQREYQAKLEAYNNRRGELGLMGRQAAERAQERQQAATQAEANRQSDREFQIAAHKIGITDDLAKMQLAHALQLERDARKAQAERLDLELKQKEINDRQARTIEYNLSSGPDAAKPEIAKEMAQYIMNGTPLSPAAQNFRNAQVQKIATQIAKLTRGGGGGSSPAQQKAVQQFENVKQKVADAAASGNRRLEKEMRQKMDAAFKQLAKYPGLELGYDQSGKWPYQKPRGGQAAPTGQPPLAGPVMAQPPDATVKAYAQRFGLSEEQARRELSGQ